jgi:hypothetical protein
MWGHVASQNIGEMTHNRQEHKHTPITLCEVNLFCKNLPLYCSIRDSHRRALPMHTLNPQQTAGKIVSNDQLTPFEMLNSSRINSLFIHID